jgi:hypothetical protein
VKIRAYHLGEPHEMCHLFHQTVNHVNAQHYNKKQLDAWSPSLSNKILGNKKLAKLGSVTGVNEKKYWVIVIYKQMVILNIFSVIVSINVKRVGEALMTHIHILAQQQNIAYLSADVSITAMTFFEKKRI